MADAASGVSRPPAYLARHHREMLESSGIKAEVIEQRGYRTVERKTELERLGFSSPQRSVPTLLVPIYGVHGDIATYQHRPDSPRMRDGKPIKYETPAGSSMVLDVPRRVLPMLDNPAVPLFITEGAKKADSAASRGLACVALLGVWSWRGSNDKGGKVALPDFEKVALNGREVTIVFDSDMMTKPPVAMALERLKAFLESRGALARVVYLPAGPNGAKTGIDDYFTRDHGTVDGLLALATDKLRATPRAPTDEIIAQADSYEMTAHRTTWQRGDDEESVETVLANFAALIERETSLVSSELEVARLFDITVTTTSGTTRFRLPAAEFESMRWPLTRVGSHATIEPGYAMTDRMRHAILRCSKPTTCTVYAHTGWTKVDGENVYMHAGGGIGAEGPVDGVEVELPQALRHMLLPPPPAHIGTALSAALHLREVAPPAIGWTLLALVFRSVLGHVPGTVFLAGTTGTRKSALAALAQAFFGRNFAEAENLPGSWSSTANSIESLIFRAKDMVCTIDDLVPADGDADKTYRNAALVLRAQANGATRGRLTADLRDRPPRPPRGALLSTGEELPRGQSVVARCLVLSIGAGDVRLPALTECQAAAADGKFAELLSAFVKWLALTIDEIRGGLRDEVEALRDELRPEMGEQAHGRTAPMVAELLVGLRWFMRFIENIGATSTAECDRLMQDARAALLGLGRDQSQHVQAEDPARRFLDALGAALAAGRCHLRHPDGKALEVPALGWRKDSAVWRPSGDAVGYVEGSIAYLDIVPAMAQAMTLARTSGAPLVVSEKALLRMFDEKKLLAGVETRGGERRRKVRKTFEGTAGSYVALALASLSSPPPANPYNTATDPLQPASSAGSQASKSWPERRPVAGCDSEPARIVEALAEVHRPNEAAQASAETSATTDDKGACDDQRPGWPEWPESVGGETVEPDDAQVDGEQVQVW